MEAMRAHFEREADLEGPWTSYNPSLGRPLLDSRKFMQGEKPVAATVPQENAVSPSATDTAAEPPTTPGPVIDLVTEQKA
jgi:hypothetical protein